LFPRLGAGCRRRGDETGTLCGGWPASTRPARARAFVRPTGRRSIWRSTRATARNASKRSYIGQATNGIGFTQLERRHLTCIRYGEPDQVMAEEVAVA
jgi:hypothetical protein